MNRFWKTFVLLLGVLILLLAGLNTALDRFGRCASENSFVWYNERGEAVVAYTGPQALLQKFPRTAPISTTLNQSTGGQGMAMTVDTAVLPTGPL